MEILSAAKHINHRLIVKKYHIAELHRSRGSIAEFKVDKLVVVGFAFVVGLISALQFAERKLFSFLR